MRKIGPRSREQVVIGPSTLTEKPAGWRAFFISKSALAIWAIVLLGAALRFYRLDARSLWLDEIITAYSGRFDTLGQLMGYVRFWIDNTPLIFVQIWLLRGLGGGEIAIRLPFAVAGILNIVAIYYLGKTLAGRRVGLLSALLMSMLPFAVWYSQEARHYAPLMLLTTLQMLFAYRATLHSRGIDWALFASFTVLNLYTSYLALTATLAAYIFISITLLVGLFAAARSPVSMAADTGVPPPVFSSWRPVLTRLVWLALVSIAVGVAYLPWLPALEAFLARKDVGFGGLPAAYQPNLGDLLGLLADFDLTDLSLLLLCVGLVAHVAGLTRGRWRQATLILTSLAVSLLIFWLNAHWAILKVPARYFSTLYPLAVLLVASGVNFLALAVSRVVSRLRAPRFTRATRTAAGPLAFAVLSLLLLAQIIPALAISYGRPKEEYRRAAEIIISSSPPDSVVIGMRMKSVLYFSKSLQYYLDLLHSPIMAEDASLFDYQAAWRLANGKSGAWGFVYQSLTGEEKQRAATEGLDVIPLVGLTLLRPRSPGLSPVEQAEALLRWGSEEEPALQADIDLLRAVAGVASFGDNQLGESRDAIVPDTSIALLSKTEPAERWLLWPGSSLANGESVFHLRTNQQEMNVTWLTRRIAPDSTYALLFRYRNDDLFGAQRVYVSAHSADGRWLATFPGGLGYLCEPTTIWTEQGFAFRVPAETSDLRIWLRATGTGSADFDQVELRPIR